MPPNRNNLPPPPSGGSQPSLTPQAPHYEYGATPQFQQHQNGTYEVVPPLPAAGNTGHSGHNPYEFIVSPNTPRPGHAPFGRLMSSWKSLALLGGGIVIALFIVGMVVSSLAPKGSTPGLTTAAQQQQEIIRVATATTQHAANSDVRNFAVTVQLTISSSQQQTVTYLAAHGTKLNNKVLAAKQSTETDTLLANAATAGNYDSTATQTLTSQLQNYEDGLQSTFKQANSTSSKALLRSNFQTAEKLLAQAKTLNPTSD
jgi:hypothetical protein